jgi:hypothetical protein
MLIKRNISERLYYIAQSLNLYNVLFPIYFFFLVQKNRSSVFEIIFL